MIFSKFFDEATRYFAVFQDRLFERKYGINTSAIISGEELNTNSLYKKNATAYQGVWYLNIKLLLEVAIQKGLIPAETNFIDVGCGMGKACFAATEFNFKKVSGFDFDKTLVEQAKKNLKKSHKKLHIDFFEGDATEYRIQNEPTLIFMFNPFDDIVMRKFLDINRELFQKKVTICYANDKYAHIFNNYGLKQIYRDNKRQISIWNNA